MNKLNPNIEFEANTAALLNNLMYLNVEWVGIKDESIIKDIVHELAKVYNSPTGYDIYNEKCEQPTKEDYEIRQHQYNQIKNAINENKYYGDLSIDNQSLLMNNPSYEVGGLNSATFEDSNKKIFLAYRGTGSGEWIDNGKGLAGLAISTPQQNQAVEYFDRVIEKNSFHISKPEILVLGHSKGGNKAQFTTINSSYNELISKCYSFDGQGMSPEAVKAFKENNPENYRMAIDKIYGFNHKDDYVNPLGVYIIKEKNRFYFETPEGVHLPKLKDIQRYHYSDLYLNDSGKFTTQAEQGYLGKLVHFISDDIIKIAPDSREHVTSAVMDIMQKKLGYGKPVNNDRIGDHIKRRLMYRAAPILVKNIFATPPGLDALSDILKQINPDKIPFKMIRYALMTYASIAIYTAELSDIVKDNAILISQKTIDIANKTYKSFINKCNIILNSLKKLGSNIEHGMKNLYKNFVNALKNIIEWAKTTKNKIISIVKPKEKQLDAIYKKESTVPNKLAKEIMELKSINKLPFKESCEKYLTKIEGYLPDKVNNKKQINMCLSSMKERLENVKSTISRVEKCIDNIDKYKDISKQFDSKILFKKSFQNKHQNDKLIYDKSKVILSNAGIENKTQLETIKGEYNKYQNAYTKVDKDRKLSLEQKKSSITKKTNRDQNKNIGKEIFKEHGK
ncbi:MAG: Mbeg1-like protein [Clostridiales bacterium]